MKTTAIIAAACLVAMTAHAEVPTSVRAQVLPPPQLMPPPQYDHAFNGEVVTIHAVDQPALKVACGYNMDHPGVFGGCAQHVGNTCIIFLAPKDYFAKFGQRLENTIRHEIAHCNGWPKDHPAAIEVPGIPLVGHDCERRYTPGC